MANLNRIILIGKLATEPEVRSTIDGVPMTKFKLSVSRLGAGGTDVFDVVAWRRMAEVCGQYLKRGQLTLIEGRIQIRSFEDQLGVRRWATEIVAQNMQMMEKSPITDRPSSPIEPKIDEDEAELESNLPF